MLNELLPTAWGTFTPQQKIDWFNANNITADVLRYAGIPESDVQASISMGLKQMQSFAPFTEGPQGTSLPTPTLQSFYSTLPTAQVPYSFRSGVSGYTNLLPQSLEFGVPAAPPIVRTLPPASNTGNAGTGTSGGTGTSSGSGTSGGITNTDVLQSGLENYVPEAFSLPALTQAYEDMTGVTYGGIETTPSYMGGKIGDEHLASYEGGGFVAGLLGPKPANQDDGYGSLQKGEYVIRKKAVNKYGEDFLEALNESRISKKRAKGLL